jgi:Ca-activated chloride channel family protein
MRVPEIKLIPLQEAVSTEHPTTLDLLIRIIPPELKETIERPPLNIGLVIDRSDSMSGQKMDYVIQTAIYAVEQLLTTDRVSVTIYDHEIETIVPSMLAEDKASIIRKINRIYNRGKTAFHGGWVQGGIQVSQHLNPEHLNRIILLSDGIPDVGETSPDVITSDVHGLAERGISTTTMSVGRDCNKDLMEAMAYNGNGNYYNIRSTRQLQSILNIEMQGLSATIGNDVTLAIKTLVHIKDFELLSKCTTNDKGQYCLPNLQFGDPIEVVARLIVPPLGQTSELCGVYLSWHDPKQDGRGDCKALLKLPSVSSAELKAYDYNVDVRQQVTLLIAERTREEAWKLVDSGYYEKAIQTLQQARKEISRNPDFPMIASEAEALDDFIIELNKHMYVSNRKLKHKPSRAISHGFLQSHSLHTLDNRNNKGPELGDITRQQVDAIVNSAGYKFFKLNWSNWMAVDTARLELQVATICLRDGLSTPEYRYGRVVNTAKRLLFRNVIVVVWI